jgi:hypothetical protein
VSIKGGPHEGFRRALEIGRLPLVLAAARWLGRLALERPATTLAELRLAGAACELLPRCPEAVGVLRALTRA